MRKTLFRQSAVKPEDSCFNQLLSITHKIHKTSDDGFKDKVKIASFWMFLKPLTKLVRQFNLLDILSNFLSDRKQSCS